MAGKFNLYPLSFILYPRTIDIPQELYQEDVKKNNKFLIIAKSGL